MSSFMIVPTVLDKMMTDVDKDKASRAMNAMLQMKKLDIKTLENAFNGKDKVT